MSQRTYIMASPDSDRYVGFLKGLVFKDSDIEQVILTSSNQPVYFVFKFPRFHRTCKCNDEHELFQYIHDNHVIDKEMFDKIFTALEVGHCPHVDSAKNFDKRENMSLGSEFSMVLDTGVHVDLIPSLEPSFTQNYRRTTGVFSNRYQSDFYDDDLEVSRTSLLHVAAALGNNAVVSYLSTRREEIQSHISMYSSSSYKHPWKIAVLRKQTAVLPMLLLNNSLSGEAMYRQFPSEAFLYDQALFLVVHDCSVGLDLLLSSISNSSRQLFYSNPVMASVIYNRPRILAVLSDYGNIMLNIFISQYHNDHISTWQLAKLLGYHACAYEIEKHIPETAEQDIQLDTRSAVNIIIWVLNLTDTLHVEDTDIIVETLKCLAATSSLIKDAMCSHEVLERLITCVPDAQVFMVFFDCLDCDIDSQLFMRRRGPTTILCEVLRRYMDFTFLGLRRVVKALLYCNPSSNMNASEILRLGCTFDMNWEFSARGGFDIETYQTMKQHEEDTYEIHRLANILSDRRFHELLFYVPILFEHGFMCHSVLVRSPAHPLLRLVYHSLSSTPRCLKSMARMALRQTYRGRQIHEFVNQAQLPVSVRKYILMEEELNQFCAV